MSSKQFAIRQNFSVFRLPEEQSYGFYKTKALFLSSGREGHKHSDLLRLLRAGL